MGKNEPNPVGQQIREEREKKGLSIQALSAEAGCHEEYLDWVETGQVEAPVALLIKLAKALKLDSHHFLNMDHTADERHQEIAKRTEHYSYVTLTPPEPDKHLMAFSVNVPPRTAHKGVGYRHEGEEFVYVLSGELEVTVERDVTTLSARQSIRFNSNLDHYLSNPGDVEAELLVILYLP